MHKVKLVRIVIHLRLEKFQTLLYVRIWPVRLYPRLGNGRVSRY